MPAIILIVALLGTSDVLFFHGQVGVEMSKSLSVTPAKPAEDCKPREEKK